MSERQPGGRAREGGSAVVEFVLVSVVALVLAMSIAQLGLFLWERNALMGSLSEGARVAATEGRSVGDGARVASELLRRAAGERVAAAVPIEGSEAGGVVVLRAEGTLPSFVPGVPGLPVRMTARMHEEESLWPVLDVLGGDNEIRHETGCAGPVGEPRAGRRYRRRRVRFAGRRSGLARTRWEQMRWQWTRRQWTRWEWARWDWARRKRSGGRR